MPPQPSRTKQRGDGRGREHRQGRVRELVEDGEPDRRRDRAAGDRDHDTRRLLDRRVFPDRSVEPGELVRDELGRERQREVQDGTARQVARHAAFETGEERQRPRNENHGRVEKTQTRVVEPPREAIDPAREPALVVVHDGVSGRRTRGRVRAVDRCCGSFHCAMSLLAPRHARSGRASDELDPPNSIDQIDRRPDLQHWFDRAWLARASRCLIPHAPARETMLAAPRLGVNLALRVLNRPAPPRRACVVLPCIWCLPPWSVRPSPDSELVSPLTRHCTHCTRTAPFAPVARRSWRRHTAQCRAGPATAQVGRILIAPTPLRRCSDRDNSRDRDAPHLIAAGPSVVI